MVTVAGGDGVWLVGTGPYRRLGAFSIKVPGGGGRRNYVQDVLLFSSHGRVQVWGTLLNCERSRQSAASNRKKKTGRKYRIL